ncbi:MAG: hypothetical protein FWD55_03135 [Propionibacteriaceae bacterium]|nr:hypothetical protein [Propionibacteriaceae bacterium]
MTGLQYAVAAGGLSGAGLWLVIRSLLPAYPNLAQTLVMLSPFTPVKTTEKLSGWEAVGRWGIAALPEKIRPIPAKDLALLRVTPAWFIARKMTYALIGFLLPGVASTCLLLVGIHLPWVAPGLVILLGGVLGFLLPDMEVRSRAARSRSEFSRTLACFVDLVALERACGSGTKQALDMAASVGDSWVFTTLRECLDRNTWAGVTGWDGLRELAVELDVSDLADVADIIALSGAEGAGVNRILRAKARTLREGILLADVTKANEVNEKMSLPVSVLGIVFLAILITPALLSMMIAMP